MDGWMLCGCMQTRRDYKPIDEGRFIFALRRLCDFVFVYYCSVGFDFCFFDTKGGRGLADGWLGGWMDGLDVERAGKRDDAGCGYICAWLGGSG